MRRELQARFVELFHREPKVQSAYLARTDYRDSTGVHVALCVRSSAGESTSIKRQAADILGAMFGSHEHLDILFIGDDQEEELQKVCRSFYRAE